VLALIRCINSMWPFQRRAMGGVDPCMGSVTGGIPKTHAARPAREAAANNSWLGSDLVHKADNHVSGAFGHRKALVLVCETGAQGSHRRVSGA
jgi:hypothetical protein